MLNLPSTRAYRKSPNKLSPSHIKSTQIKCHILYSTFLYSKQIDCIPYHIQTNVSQRLHLPQTVKLYLLDKSLQSVKALLVKNCKPLAYTIRVFYKRGEYAKWRWRWRRGGGVLPKASNQIPQLFLNRSKSERILFGGTGNNSHLNSFTSID